MVLALLPSQVPLGRAALQDEDSKKTLEDVYTLCATSHNVRSPYLERGGRCFHQRADGLAHIGPHTNPVIPSLLAKSFWESQSTPGRRDCAYKYCTEQGVMAKRAPCIPFSNRH